ASQGKGGDECTLTNALLTMWDMVQVFRALDLLAEAALGTPELMPTENGSSGEVSPGSEG
ncbi:MAG: hypothetical protein WKF62_04460, partial [Solirubrobacterales bacterium]